MESHIKNKCYQGRQLRDISIAHYAYESRALLLPSIHATQACAHTLNTRSQIWMKATNYKLEE